MPVVRNEHLIATISTEHKGKATPHLGGKLLLLVDLIRRVQVRFGYPGVARKALHAPVV